MSKVIQTIVLTLTVGGCAFGNTIDYGKQPLTLSVKTDRAMTVAVDDKRPYVISGDNTPEFVGVIRSGVGIPYGVHTTSKQPLASDFSALILSALKANGIRASAIPISVSSSREPTIRALTTIGTDRSLLVTISDWKSDKYLATTLNYALKAEVLDAAGDLLASNSVRGEQSIGVDPINPVGNLERGATNIAQRAINQLLDDQKITDALR